MYKSQQHSGRAGRHRQRQRGRNPALFNADGSRARARLVGLGAVSYTHLNAAGQEVAVVSKELFNWTDTYSIDVYNPQDALYALMLVLAIDAEKCSRN